MLRLRQTCSHPALIQEDGVALIGPDELDETLSPEARDELSRARELVSPDFVAKMKQKLKETALRRIEAEKESVDAVIEDEVNASTLIITFNVLIENLRNALFVWMFSLTQ